MGLGRSSTLNSKRYTQNPKLYTLKRKLYILKRKNESLNLKIHQALLGIPFRLLLPLVDHHFKL